MRGRGRRADDGRGRKGRRRNNVRTDAGMRGGERCGGETGRARGSKEREEGLAGEKGEENEGRWKEGSM